MPGEIEADRPTGDAVLEWGLRTVLPATHLASGLISLWKGEVVSSERTISWMPVKVRTVWGDEREFILQLVHDRPHTQLQGGFDILHARTADELRVDFLVPPVEIRDETMSPALAFVQDELWPGLRI